MAREAAEQLRALQAHHEEQAREAARLAEGEGMLQANAQAAEARAAAAEAALAEAHAALEEAHAAAAAKQGSEEVARKLVSVEDCSLALGKRVNELARRCDALVNERDSARRRAAEGLTRATNADIALAAAKEALAGVRAELAEARGQVGRLDDALAAREEEAAALRRQNGDLATEVAARREGGQGVKAQLDELRAAAAGMRQELGALGDERAALREALLAQEAKAAYAEKQRAVLQRSHAALMQEHAQLEQRHAEHLREGERARWWCCCSWHGRAGAGEALDQSWVAH